MPLTHSITHSDGIHTITVSGRLLAKEDAEDLIAAFEQTLEQNANRFLMNLSELEYVNSTGLNLLIGLFTKARNAGGELVVGGISKKVRKLMVMTKLDSIFRIFDTEEEAKAHI